MSSGTSEKRAQNSAEDIQLGWDDEHESYTCCGGEPVEVPRRTANVRCLDETKTVPRNGIVYRTNEDEASIVASGVEFGRDMEKVFGGPDDVRTIIFPNMVRIIR